jgi:hypothetical protein
MLPEDSELDRVCVLHRLADKLYTLEKEINYISETPLAPQQAQNERLIESMLKLARYMRAVVEYVA